MDCGSVSAVFFNPCPIDGNTLPFFAPYLIGLALAGIVWGYWNEKRKSAAYSKKA